MSSFDDKRYILDDGISTLPYAYIEPSNESSEPPSNDSRGGNNSSTFHADSANDEMLDRDSDDDDDLDAWVAHFEDSDAPIEWDQENILDGMSQELDRTQIDWDYTQDVQYDSQDSFIDPAQVNHMYIVHCSILYQQPQMKEDSRLRILDLHVSIR